MTLWNKSPGHESFFHCESDEQPVASLDASRLHQLLSPPQEENGAVTCR